MKRNTFISSDIFDIHYLWTLEGYLFGIYRNKSTHRKAKGDECISMFIEELQSIYNDFPEHKKILFIRLLKDQINDKLKFNKDKIFVKFFNEYKSIFILFIKKLIDDEEHQQKLNKHFVSQDKNQNDNKLFPFFDKIKECLPNLEIYNEVQRLTDDFELKKLELLLQDFEFYMFVEKEEKEGSFSKEDIKNAINELKSKGLPIPKIKLPKTIKDIDKEYNLDLSNNIIDLEQLLFPYEFFCCYQFKTFLKKEIKKRIDPKPSSDKVKEESSKDGDRNDDKYPKTFAELFPGLTKDDIEKRVALLREPNPLNNNKRLINEANEYIGGKLKGGIIAWTDVMKTEVGGGMVKQVPDRIMSKLYKNKFPGLNMGFGRTFSGSDCSSTSQYVKYHDFFLKKLNSIIEKK